MSVCRVLRSFVVRPLFEGYLDVSYPKDFIHWGKKPFAMTPTNKSPNPPFGPGTV